MVEHGRFRRWIDLGKKGIPPKDPAKPCNHFGLIKIEVFFS